MAGGLFTPFGKLLLLLLAVGASVTIVQGRPLVRNVRTDREFQRLIKHHKEKTGLPVIVDYYSDGCGPCRQIAPHYKRLAKQYKNKVVFAKVDVNYNRETSGRQQIRSMPTFQFYMLGRKRHQFSGADINSLQNYAASLSREAEKYDVELTEDGLKEFYTNLPGEDNLFKGDADKLNAQVAKVLKKAGDGGPGHYRVLTALTKKYADAAPPNTIKWSEGMGAKKDAPKKNDQKGGKGGAPLKPNLHLASMDALLEEIDRRKEKEEEAKEAERGEEEDDDETTIGGVKLKKFQRDATHDTIAERVIIIGAGPAGLSAAIYAARAGLKPIIAAPFEGGQLQGKGVLVENYPAVSGVTGPVIVQDMKKQAAEFGAVFLEDMVATIDVSARPFEVTTNNTSLKVHTVIMATGADSRWLGAPGEYEYRGGGVSSCATCDGFLYRDQHVVVIGGGDTAMEDALVLARTSSKVTVIHRRGEFRASHVLAQRVLQYGSIFVKWNTTVEQFEGQANEQGEKILTHLHLKNKFTGEAERMEAAAAFVAIGHDPNTKVLRGQDIEMDETGYLKTFGGTTSTSVPGFFAAGDVADRVYRQAITSAGSGAMAALDAERYLSEHGIQDEREAEIDDMMAELMAEFQVNPSGGAGIVPGSE
jgi:thioredoxin-disulfide reductase